MVNKIYIDIYIYAKGIKFGVAEKRATTKPARCVSANKNKKGEAKRSVGTRNGIISTSFKFRDGLPREYKETKG